MQKSRLRLNKKTLVYFWAMYAHSPEANLDEILDAWEIEGEDKDFVMGLHRDSVEVLDILAEDVQKNKDMAESYAKAILEDSCDVDDIALKYLIQNSKMNLLLDITQRMPPSPYEPLEVSEEWKKRRWNAEKIRQSYIERLKNHGSRKK